MGLPPKESSGKVVVAILYSLVQSGLEGHVSQLCTTPLLHEFSPAGQLLAFALVVVLCVVVFLVMA